MNTDIEKMLTLAGVDITQGKAKQLIESSKSQARVIKDDDVDTTALNKLFSQKLNPDMDEIDDWDERDLDVIHIDDGMGYDVIYHVGGKFVHFDRHGGHVTATINGVNINTVLTTITKAK